MYLPDFDGNVNDFHDEIEHFINNRIFDTGFCDVIPSIMSNVLNNTITIIDKTESDYNVYQCHMVMWHCVYVMHPREHKFCTDKTISYFDVSEVIVLLRSGDHYDACVRLKPGAFDHNELDMINSTSGNVINNTELDVNNPTESSVIGGTELDAINRTECDFDNSAEHDVINTVDSDVISTEPDVNALGGNNSFVDGDDDNHDDSDILDESLGDYYLYHAKNTETQTLEIALLDIEI